MKILAIETSCDETAVAVIDAEKFFQPGRVRADYLLHDLVASQVAKHAPYGGVVPEVAARRHIEALPLLVDQAIGTTRIDAIAATRGPGLKGSLLVGLNFAKGFAAARDIPLVPVNHLEGHVWAADLIDGREHSEGPFVALIVSGGHTFLVKVRAFSDYQLIASTRDDAAGEAFDKIAVLLGLPYPGGPALAQLAVGGDRKRFKLPVSLRGDQESFSFSGLKTAAARLLSATSAECRDDTFRRDFAASVEDAIAQNVVGKSVDACVREEVKTFVLSGGVAANSHLQQVLHEQLLPRGIELVVPPLRWCTDNAAMIAVVAARALRKHAQRYDRWSQAPTGLGPDAPYDLDVFPRRPLDKEVMA